MLRWLLIWSATFSRCGCALYDGDLYYESSDETSDRSHTIKGENCLVWKEVYDRTVKNLSSEPDKLQEYLSNTVKVEEVMLHSKCRRFDLPPEHPLKSALKISNSGPWCYVKRKGNIVAEKCFNVCKGAPREEKTSADRTQYGAREVLKNYNDLLIENIRKYYKSYSWGDVSYYRWKPSDSAFSAEYFRVREQIFYGCVITVVVLILWLLMCSYLRREAAASRRRREEALKIIFPHRKIQMHPIVRPNAC
ncbi:hypothetical protein Y032_0025g1229 [Ancylostoma ceylanicum]|uniref:Kringle-like domain-containing protein n=1 Tax=Ancylostoma ceylanicum TaxID=53326 RepID=A0A016UW11_9BILA|nr:hypothetical protein Y032_0025g1229 [Ancylostoma ceylanicum]